LSADFPLKDYFWDNADVNRGTGRYNSCHRIIVIAPSAGFQENEWEERTGDQKQRLSFTPENRHWHAG